MSGRVGTLRTVEANYSNGVGSLGRTINTYTGSGQGVQFNTRTETVGSCSIIIGLEVSDTWNVYAGFEADNNTYIGGNGSGQINIRQGGTDVAGGSISANTPTIIGVSFSGTTMRVFKNGVFQFSGTGGSTAFSSTWNFGGNAGGGGTSNPKIAFAYVWDRPLPDADQIALGKTPYSLFGPLQRDVFVDVLAESPDLDVSAITRPPQPRVWQPHAGTLADRSVDSRLLALFSPGVNPRGAGPSILGTPTSVTAGAVVPLGVPGEFNGTSSNIRLSRSLPNSRFTVMAGVLTAASTLKYIVGTDYGVGGDNTEHFSLRLDSNNVGATFYAGMPFVAEVAGPGAGVYITAFSLVGDATKTDDWYAGYVSAAGAETISSATSVSYYGSSPSRNARTAWIGCGANNGSVWRFYDNRILWVGIFDGWLSKEQRRAYAENPWQLFEPQRRRFFAGMAAEGGTTDGVGSLSATGTIAGIGASNRAGVGSLTATGTIAGVGASNRAGVGSLSATGTISAVGENASGGVVSGVGSLSATGTIAGVGASNRAGVGSLSATGTIAGVGASNRAGVGSLSATGTIAGVGANASSGGVGILSATGTILGVGASTRAAVGTLNATFTLVGTDQEPVTALVTKKFGFYIPDPVLLSPDPTVQYLIRELQKIQTQFQLGIAQTIVFHTSEPNRPYEGMMVGADGTDWNPGSGRGIYARVNSAWVKLG